MRLQIRRACAYNRAEYMASQFRFIMSLIKFYSPPNEKGGWRVLLWPLSVSNEHTHSVPGCTEGRSTSQRTLFWMGRFWRRLADTSADQSSPASTFPAAPCSLAVEVLLQPLPSPLPSHQLCCQEPAVHPRWALRGKLLSRTLRGQQPPGISLCFGVLHSSLYRNLNH